MDNERTKLRPEVSPRDAGEQESCNHRGFEREFERTDLGVVMICSGCGGRVVPASRPPIAA